MRQYIYFEKRELEAMINGEEIICRIDGKDNICVCEETHARKCDYADNCFIGLINGIPDMGVLGVDILTPDPLPTDTFFEVDGYPGIHFYMGDRRSNGTVRIISKELVPVKDYPNAKRM